MSLRVVGLDLSLTATGIAYPDGTTATHAAGKAGQPIEQRAALLILDLAHHIDEVRFDFDADLVVIEDCPARVQGRAGLGVPMLHGIIRWWLESPIALVQPSSLKKYATGKGNASKTEVLIAARDRLGYTGTDDNQADALWLRAMALDHYRPRGTVLPFTVPKVNKTALDAIDWPEITP